MDDKTRVLLNEINRQFYNTTASEFDATRGQSWPGWHPVLKHIPDVEPLRVLDLGCGNGRFGLFLAEHLDRDIHYVGVDNNPDLLNFAAKALADKPRLRVSLVEQDIVIQHLGLGNFHLIVLFGVVHHIPGTYRRKEFLRSRVSSLEKHGVMVFRSVALRRI